MDKQFTWSDDLFIHFPKLVDNMKLDKEKKSADKKERKARLEEIRFEQLYSEEELL